MKWFVQLFIKEDVDTCNVKVRQTYGKFASTAGIISNILLFAMKIVIGIISRSVAVTADAVNNLSDASSSIVSLVGFKLAGKPADEEHPYGHGRYEYISGLVVAVTIIVIGIELGKSSFEKILSPEPIVFSWISLAVLCVSVLIKLWQMLLYRYVGKKINSQTLIATAADSRNDCIATCAVIASLVVAYFFKIEIDGYMGIIVAVFILVNGFGIIRDTIDPMLGTAPDAEYVEGIRARIMSYPGVLGTHDLMIHDYGVGRQFASVHVEMAAEADVIECHDVIDNIERDFMNDDGLHMIVHYDPIVTGDESTNNVRAWLVSIVTEIDSELSIHDLRIVPGVTHTNLVFDCVVPNNERFDIAQVKAGIIASVQACHPDYFCVITIDRSYCAQ